MRARMSLFSALLAGVVFTGMNSVAEVVLLGDTSKPRSSLFTPGEEVWLTFNVVGLKPNQRNVTLKVDVRDELDKAISEKDFHVEVDGHGNAVCTIPAPAGKLGFYRVYGTLSDGTKIAPSGSREGGFITYAVIADPAARRKYTMEYSHNAAGVPGGPWSGGPGQWGHLEAKHHGQYSKNPDADKIVLRDSLTTLGPVKPGELRDDYTMANLLPSIPRNWKDSKEHFKNGAWVLSPECEQYLGDYCEVFARNYAKQFADHPYRVYQNTWESVPKYGVSTFDDYRKLYRIAYEALHKGDAKAVVIGITEGFDDASASHTENFLRAGLGKYLDGISHHSYTTFPVEANGLVDKCRRYRAMVKELAGKELPIYGTEFGYSTAGLKSKENTQMFGVVRGSLIMLGEGWKTMFQFFSFDYRNELGFGLQYNLDFGKDFLHDFGTKKLAPKPVVPALAAMVSFVEGHNPVCAIEYLGDTAWGYSYQGADGDVVLALWDYSGRPRGVEIPVGRTEVDVADMMGNVGRRKTDEGVLKLTLTESPCYVLNVDPKLWGKDAVKMITFDSTGITTVAGAEIAIVGKVNAPEQKIVGELQVYPDKKLGMKPGAIKIEAEARGDAGFRFSYVVPAGTAIGKYPFLAKLSAQGKVVASGGLLVEVKAPVETLAATPVFEAGRKGIAIEMEEAAGLEAAGTVNVRVVGEPDGRATFPFTLKPGEKRIFTHFYSELDCNPLKDSTVEFEYLMRNGYKFKSTLEMNFLPVPYKPEICVDGDFSDWKDLPAMPVDESMAARSKQFYGGAKDLSGSVRIAWNEKYLLFHVVVNDDMFMQPESGWKTWAYDCLQMAFTRAYRIKGTNNEYMDKMDRSYTELDFALTPKGPEVYRTVTFDDKNFPLTAVDLKDAPLHVLKTALPDGRARLEYEFGVPWRILNIGAPKVGDQLGWAMTMNDRDSGGIEEHNPTMLEAFELKAPEKFGMLTLTK